MSIGIRIIAEKNVHAVDAWRSCWRKKTLQATPGAGVVTGVKERR
jgi:hypothetical protein